MKMHESKDKEKNRRFLIAVDESESSHMAVSYVADLLSQGNGATRVILFHLLPPMPPRLVEHGGAEDPDEERRREEALAKKRENWIDQSRRDARPIMEAARSVLRQARVPEEVIQERYTTTIHGSVAKEALEVANQLGCGTIVVGRQSFPWYQELTKHHVAEDLLKDAENVAVCVVQ